MNAAILFALGSMFFAPLGNGNTAGCTFDEQMQLYCIELKVDEVTGTIIKRQNVSEELKEFAKGYEKFFKEYHKDKPIEIEPEKGDIISDYRG